MPNSIVRVENLKKYFHMGGSGRNAKYLHAVDDVSLNIEKGMIFGVVGESGCGKSTLGRCVLRLTDVSDGKIFFEDNEITQLKTRELKPYRRKMQMVFQNPFSSFNPMLSIGTSFREVCSFYRMPKDETEKKIKELLEIIRLPDDVLHRHPNELSGGQLQRLAIERTLLLSPSFIVADEPVSALDVSVQAQILNLMSDLREELGLTMMFISHELTVVEHLCDMVAVMYLGVVVETAPTAELFKNVIHPYSQALISAKPRETPEQQTNRIILEGDVPSAIDIPEGCRFAGRCPKRKDGKCDKIAPQLREIEPGHFVACHLAQSEKE
jgi:oligopeptide/dipeptide ABC transporter ATP-binding protein